MKSDVVLPTTRKCSFRALPLLTDFGCTTIWVRAAHFFALDELMSCETDDEKLHQSCASAKHLAVWVKSIEPVVVGDEAKMPFKCIVFVRRSN